MAPGKSACNRTFVSITHVKVEPVYSSGEAIQRMLEIGGCSVQSKGDLWFQ